jgi:hypothetical protein
MSGKNNVNKDFYTIAGRDRPNEVVMASGDTAGSTDEGHFRRGAQPNFIPGALPVGVVPEPKPAPPARRRRGSAAHEADTSAGKTGGRSGPRKRAAASRGGKASGKARAKAGAAGKSARRPANTARAKRGTTRGAAVTKRRGAGRSKTRKSSTGTRARRRAE